MQLRWLPSIPLHIPDMISLGSLMLCCYISLCILSRFVMYLHRNRTLTAYLWQPSPYWAASSYILNELRLCDLRSQLLRCADVAHHYYSQMNKIFVIPWRQIKTSAMNSSNYLKVIAILTGFGIDCRTRCNSESIKVSFRILFLINNLNNLSQSHPEISIWVHNSF